MFASPAALPTECRRIPSPAAWAGIFRFQQPQHLLGDALARKPRDAALLGRHRAQRTGVDRALAVPSMETEQAQDA